MKDICKTRSGLIHAGQKSYTEGFFHSSFVALFVPHTHGLKQTRQIPGRAADRAGAVEVCEPESPRSQPVQVWSECTRVSVTPQVPETQIICEKEDEVRRRGRAGARKKSAEQEEADVVHPASSCVWLRMRDRGPGPSGPRGGTETNVTCPLSRTADVTHG